VKNLIFCFGVVGILFIASCSSAPPPVKLSEPLAFSEVVDVTNVSQTELFTRANIWFVNTFNNAESVIEFSDKDSGVIVGKYLMRQRYRGYPAQIITIIRVEIREERYRISFTDPQWDFSDLRTAKYQPVDTEELAAQIIPEWNKLAESLKIVMISTESDW
jgi:hypothetical protein